MITPRLPRCSVTLIAVALGCALFVPARAQTTTQITVNVYNDRHSISKYIYGGSFPVDAAYIRGTGMTLSRWGGNNMTSYNWKLKAVNLDFDWFFENQKGDDSLAWVKWVEDAGSAAIINIPMVDWAPKDYTSNSYSVKKYGKQAAMANDRPDAGNGKSPDGAPITTNDPSDAYVPLLDKPGPDDPPGSVYRDEWIRQLAKAFGNWPHFYEADNEPEIWAGTHQDIHPKPVTYDELRDRFIKTSLMIKANDPKAIVAGPITCAQWFYWNSAAGRDDKAAHDGVDFFPWWLGAIASDDKKRGSRTLDMFDIHAYGDVDTGGKTEVEANAMRLRSTRQWWDPSFVPEGGYGKNHDMSRTQPVINNLAVIPRMRAMLNGIYPGTEKFAISEWSFADNWNDKTIVTALADADAYGILGRENAYAATRWGSAGKGTIAMSALAMYNIFADVSVQARNSLSPDVFSSFAAVTSDGKRLTIVGVNKDPKNAVNATVHLGGFKPASMTEYILDSSNSIRSFGPKVWPASYAFEPYTVTLLSFTGKADARAADWSLSPDDLMMTAGTTANLAPKSKTAKLRLTGVKADPGITIKIADANVSPAHHGRITVTAGQTPGFYHYTVTAKTSSGVSETQSGWIVVGVKGSMP